MKFCRLTTGVTFTGLTAFTVFFQGGGWPPRPLALEALTANDEGHHLFSQHMTGCGYLYIGTVPLQQVGVV